MGCGDLAVIVFVYQGTAALVGDTGGVTIELICPSTHNCALVIPLVPSSTLTHPKTTDCVKSA